MVSVSESRPPSSEAQLRRLAQAHAFLQAGRPDDAERECRELLAQAPDHVDTLNLLGGVLMKRGRSEEGLALLQRAAAIAPEVVVVQSNLARAALQNGLPELARQAAQAAIDRDASRAGNWLLLGGALKELDRLDAAVEAFSRALQLAPQDPAPAYNLAVCEVLAGRAASAVPRLQALVARLPQQPPVWQALGNAQAAMGRIDEALPAYREALRLDPRHVGTWVNLAVTCLEAGRLPEAADAVRHALALAPGDASVLAAAGVHAVRNGDEALARALFDFEALLDGAPFGGSTGFTPDQDFLGELEREVLAHPTLLPDPASKTTREGRQSSNLAHEQSGALGRFVAHLRAQLPQRIEAMQRAYAALGHPAAGTAPAKWRLNLWSTVLHRGGHQQSHLHPAGWLSGVYYLRSPACETGPEGWIEFGPPPDPLQGGIAHPLRRLPPQQGLLLTFPSYLYHRTVPHADDRQRISLAFDVVPDSG